MSFSASRNRSSAIITGMYKGNCSVRSQASSCFRADVPCKPLSTVKPATISGQCGSTGDPQGPAGDLIVSCAPPDDRLHYVFHITRGKPRQVLRSCLTRRVPVGGSQIWTRDLITGSDDEFPSAILIICSVKVYKIMYEGVMCHDLGVTPIS